MKTRHFFGAALLGLAFSSSAFAQTVVPSAPGVPTAPGTVVPGTPVTPGSPTTPSVGTGAVVPGQLGTSTPIATPPGTVYTPAGTAPAAGSPALTPANTTGTLQSDQPAGVRSTVPGSRTRRNATRSTTTTRP